MVEQKKKKLKKKKEKKVETSFLSKTGAEIYVN